MAVLDKHFLHKLKSNIIFVVIYTIAFILMYETFPYIAPFLIGGMIAFVISPISQKLKKKFKINTGISTLILSFLGVAIVIGLASAFIVSGTKHLVNLLNNISQNSDYINQIAMDLASKASSYIEYIQDASNINIESLIAKYSGSLMNITKNLLASIIGLASSIPYIAIFTITLFIATYFIAKDIDIIERSFYNMFAESTKVKVKNVKKEILSSIVGYIRAYTILMGITFLITWISFAILKIPYSSILGFIAAILDLIPFLGITVIYVPAIIYYWIIENYFLVITISIVFVGLSLLRQILEPKLVSINIGLSPLATLAAIFIGIQVKGIIGIIFFLGLVMMHQILKKVDIL